MIPFPDKKYQIIYADPPWKYNNKANKKGRTVETHYPTMNTETIKNIQVCAISDNNCILFIWVTFPKLQEGLDVIQAWGFEYKTIAFTWVKKNKIANSWFWGMGKWTRSNAELCLLATKGKPKRISAGVSSIIDNKIQAHSQKPDEARDRIVQLCGDLPRIELFARQQTPGWDAWGNEVDMQVPMIKFPTEEQCTL